jgi:DNA-binding NtrC family response regulator
MEASSTGFDPVEVESEQAAFAPESQVEPRDLRTLKAARREAIDRFEVEYIQTLLRKSGGNVTRAAALAEVSRQVIHKLIARHRRRQAAVDTSG